MTIVLKNATYIDWESLEFTHADILVESGAGGGIRLLPPGAAHNLAAGHTVTDCSGRFVMKSFAVGHHHAYSALARGMPAPARQPANFREILQYIWWKLDKGLDAEMIRYSGLVTAMAAVRAGSTFVIDHHASPNCIEGSLDLLAEAFDEVGVGHLLCYEVTDRNGEDGARRGLEETRRFLARRQGLVGLHASFTVGEATLDAAVALMHEFGTGVHVHAAEDVFDQEHCLKTYGMRVMKRWHDAGLMNEPRTIMVHGLHLDGAEREMFRNASCWIAQNIESNLNNRVGHFDGSDLGDHIMLGTDGMHSNMLLSCKATYFAGLSRDDITYEKTYRRLRNVNRYIRSNGFAGDGDNNLVVLHYDHPTPFHAQNFFSHFIFGIQSSHIEHVIAQGRFILQDRCIQTVDEDAIMRRAQELATKLWSRMR